MERARTFSHVALNVGRGEGPLAARFLGHLGLDVHDNGPSGRGESWYTAVLDAGSYDGGLEHLGFFVVPVSEEQLALEATLTRQCAAERAGYADERWHKPDANGHIAVAFGDLAELEAAVVRLRTDDEVIGRVQLRTVRPQTAPSDLAARLDRSPVFADAERVQYLHDGVQVFCITDIVSAGLLCLGQAFELNYTASVP